MNQFAGVFVLTHGKKFSGLSRGDAGWLRQKLSILWTYVLIFLPQKVITLGDQGMDFSRTIIEFLGIQDVIIEDIKRFKKDLRLEVKVRQKRSECFCPHCGLQFASVKEWSLREVKAPPLGVYQEVLLKFWQMRGYCEDCQCTAVARADWLHPKFGTSSYRPTFSNRKNLLN